MPPLCIRALSPVLLIAVSPLFLFAPSQAADFGAAEVKQGSLGIQPPLVFNAWCAVKYSRCTVRFSENHLLIDGGDPISKSAVLSWKKVDSHRVSAGFIGDHHLYSFDFSYARPNKDPGLARILFQDTASADQFFARLRVWIPDKQIDCAYNFELRKEVCR